MALEGTFRDFHIADILQLIGLQHKTGTLTLEGEEDTLTVSFRDGAVAWAQSTRLPWDHRMAQVLVPRGLITPTQLQEALTLQRDSKKKLSSILLEHGYLQRKDWDSLLAGEVEEAVYRPFRWTSGRYRFVSQPSVDAAEGKIAPLSTERVLMEGIRRLDEWPTIREKVPSPAMVFKVGTQPGRLNPKRVEPNEVKMLDLVDGKRTVQELVDASGLGEFEAMRGLASLVSAGAIAAIGPVTAPPSVEAPAVRVTPSLPARPLTAPPPWVARVAWGVAAVWLVVSLPLFRAEPLGLFPLSAARTASLDRVRSLRAQADLVELTRDVERFAVLTGEYPRGLEVLGTGGRPIADPWGHPYQIRRSETGVSVISAGPDGRTGTTDDVTITGG